MRSIVVESETRGHRGYRSVDGDGDGDGPAAEREAVDSGELPEKTPLAC
jgi:hypothetical protein